MATKTAPSSSRPDRQTSPPADHPTEQVVLATLVVLLLAELPAPELTARVRVLLAPLELTAGAVEAAVALAGGVAIFQPAGGQAVRHLARTATPRRAAYLLAAARRLSAAEAQGAPTVALRAERRYLAQHLAAERTRVQAAGRVDVATGEFGPVLGWYAKQDAITSRACRRAHGRNFRADRPPVLPTSEEGHRVVGFPGTPHGGACRCAPGRPWPGGVLMPVG